MNAKIIKLPGIPEELPAVKSPFTSIEPVLLLLFLMLIWYFGPGLMPDMDESASNINRSIWLLVLISLITFLLIIGLCWWLLKRFWLAANLPALEHMVSQFKTLSLCQQLSFYLASFALLVLAALDCLKAVC